MHIVDLTWLSLITFSVACYYLLLFVHPLYRRSRKVSAVGTPPLIVLVIPAHNEEVVISPTLNSLANLDYDERLVMVMNDGSSDRTSEIARSFSTSGVVVVDRAPDIAGQGKGAVLNHAFSLLADMLRSGDPKLRGRSAADIVVGVLDADGQLEPDSLSKVVPYFGDVEVGGVQIGVRIANAATNVVTRLQDLEFVGFSAFVQQARDSFGSVGLGGNGQFTRMSALLDLGRAPWTDCLTEDLELSLSLAERGWRIRFCPTTYVAQQGLTSWRPLFRQRTRWFQGHYQCWRHLPSIWRARRMAWYTKADLSIYLVMVCFVMLVFAGLVVGVVSALSGFVVENRSLAWITNDQVHNIVVLLFSFGPLAAFMITYQRRSWYPLRFWELPSFAVFFSLYAYMFVASQFWAWGRVLTRRGTWAKTPRVAAESAF